MKEEGGEKAKSVRKDCCVTLILKKLSKFCNLRKTPELKNNLVPRVLFPRPGDEVVKKSIPREIVNFVTLIFEGNKIICLPRNQSFSDLL